MTRSAPRPLRNEEVVVNLWAYSDEEGYILRVAGRSYVLDGTDDEKLAILRKLAPTDFLMSHWEPVPDRFTVTHPGGNRRAVAQLSMLNDELTKSYLVGPLLESLAKQLPQQLRRDGDTYAPFAMQLPDAPLTVLTVVVEQDDGQLVPMVNL